MNRSQHDLETLARAFNTREPSGASPSTCPDPEELIETVSGTLEREQRLRIVDHLSQCAECTQAWRLAMEIGARPSDAAEQSRWSIGSGLTRAKSIGKRRPYALAASVVCVVGIAAYLVIPVTKQPPEFRDVAPPDAPVSLVTTSLPRDRFLLRWSPGPAGSTYLLRLTTPDLDPLLVEQDLTTPEFLVPRAALENVAPGEELLWQVETQLLNGERLVSQTYAVTLD